MEKILDIKVNYNEAIKAIADYQTKIDAAREAEKNLKKQLKDGEISRQQYNEEMAASKLAISEYNDAIRVISKTVQNQIKQEKEQEGSLKSLRAQLSNLTAEYDSLSEAGRKAATGKELKDKINEITDALKGAEEETQRYYRNVGNYEESLSPLFERLEKKLETQKKKYEELVKAQGENSKAAKKMKKEIEDTQLEFEFMENATEGATESIMGFMAQGVGLDASILKMVQGVGSLAQGAKMAGNAFVAFSKTLLSLMANPIVAFLAVVSTLLLAISKGISSSEENTNRWNVIMAPFSLILDKVTKILQDMAGGILSVVEAGGKMMGWISKQLEKLPVLGKQFAEYNKQNQKYIEMAKEKAAIDRDTRDLELDNAKNALKIATLKAQADDELNVSASERMQAIREANKLEEEASKRNYELAKRKYELMVQQNELAGNTKETNDAIVQAEIEMYNALTEYQDKRGELLGREVALANEIKSAEKEKADAAKEAAEKRLEIQTKEREEIRKAEDEMLKLVVDSLDKQEQEIRLNYDRQIEDLKVRLETEKDLTVKTREALNAQITALEKQKNAELSKLSMQAIMEEEQRREDEIRAMLEAEQDYKDKQLEAVRLRFEAEIAQSRDNEEEVLRLRMEQKKFELDSIQQMENESLEAFNLRRIEAENEYLDAKEALKNREIQIEQTKLQAISDITGSLVELTEAMGESNEGFAKMSKVLALAEIAINTGKALAAGIAQAQSVPFPANLAAIATTVATILSNIASAMALAEIAINTGKALAAGIAQAQSVPFPANLAAIATTVATILSNIASATSIVKSAKFANGGLVTGPGTGTSDSIPAQLSNGESVMTARTTSMFAPILSSFNQMGGGVPINVTQTSSQALGEDMLARAFAKGVQAIRPVVSVEEINRVSNRVKVLENLGDV